MPSYKLTYFPLKALGESIRLLLSYGGVEFEDIRVPIEEWPQLKDSKPWRQLPVLEIDGRVITQNIAIARFLGRKFNLAGANDLEALEIDEIVDAYNDLRHRSANAAYEEDQDVKAKKYVDLNKDVFPFFLKKLDAIAEANKGHMALGKLTWADFLVAGSLDYLSWLVQFNIGEKYPNLKKVEDNVLALPAVVEFYKTAPLTAF